MYSSTSFAIRSTEPRVLGTTVVHTGPGQLIHLRDNALFEASRITGLDQDSLEIFHEIHWTKNWSKDPCGRSTQEILDYLDTIY